MENKTQINTRKLFKIVGALISVLLIVFEVIICVQYFSSTTTPDWIPQNGAIALLVSCFVVLDTLCVIDAYVIKTLNARIVVYVIDFVILLFICTLTSSPYLSALYCVILSELYMNVEELRTKIIVFAVSCFMFILTLVVGWFLRHLSAVTELEILEIVSDSVTGIIVLVVHFLVANFLLAFYRNNLRLMAALKEADESKAELKEAYDRLSETAAIEERNRIARDIHDNAGHSMTAVIMQTEAAKLLIDNSPEEAKAKIISANIQAKNALEQMRESVHLLAGRASVGTLKEEFEEIIAQTMDGTDVKIRYDLDEIELSDDIRRFILNSFKELLANGMRHGHATAFYVEFGGEGDKVYLTVSDNGYGLPEDFKEGFGLRGIREKAASFGGTIEYDSESGDGCEIKITVKASDKEDKDD